MHAHAVSRHAPLAAVADTHAIHGIAAIDACITMWTWTVTRMVVVVDRLCRLMPTNVPGAAPSSL